MKRLVSVCLLMLCLSFPVFGGHVPQGGYGQLCGCNPINNVCPCCGWSGITTADDQEHDSTIQNASEPSLELGVIRVAFLMWLKIRA